MVSVEVHLPLHGWHWRVERWGLRRGMSIHQLLKVLHAWLQWSWAPIEVGKQRSNLVAIELHISDGLPRLTSVMSEQMVLHHDRGCRAASTLWRVVG